MKRISLVFITIFTVLVSVFPTFAQNTVTVEKRKYIDDLEREVSVPSEVTSVVTLAPSLTETIYFLGGEDLIKGIDSNSDYPESISKVKKVTSWSAGPDYEMLLTLAPDIIFASEMTSLEEVSNMEKLGLTVYCVKNLADFDELFESILTVGVVIGRENEAIELVESLSARVDAVKDAMKDCEDKSLVFYEMDATDPTKPWTAGKDTFISSIISLSCGTNLGDELEGSWAQIGLEALIKADPDVILLGDAAYGNSPEAVTARTGWGDLSAVKNNMLFEFDDNLVSRPGPRLVEGLEVIAGLLHPECFD